MSRATDQQDDQIGARAQRARPWPTDRSAPGVTSRLSRTIHTDLDCPYYRGVQTRVKAAGGQMQPTEHLTVGEAFDRRKGICSCWDQNYSGERRVIPGAEHGHRP